MTKLTIQAKKRIIYGKKLFQIRARGIIPAVLYGHKVKNVNLEVNEHDFTTLYTKVGSSTLFDLIIDSEKPVKVIIQDIQKDPVKGEFIHIDFHQVSMKEKLHTEIPLQFIGIAPAVKTFGGVLVTNKNGLNVKCLPQDLVSEIQVDVSVLQKLEDSIKIKDIKIPEKIEVLDNPNDIVASVKVTKEEVEQPKPAPGAEAATPEAAKASEAKETENKEGKAEEAKPGQRAKAEKPEKKTEKK